MRPHCLSYFLNSCAFSASDRVLYFSSPRSDSLSFSSDNVTYLVEARMRFAVQSSEAMARALLRLFLVAGHVELILWTMRYD